MKYKQYLADYEAETGAKPSDFLRQYVEALDYATELFKTMGKEHAGHGREPLTKDDLMVWVKRNARAELVGITNDFIYISYLEGYKSGGVAA